MITLHKQSSLYDTYASLPTELHIPDYILDSLTVTPYAVESILSYLQLEKAAGPDGINNRILKELKDVLSAPLSDLLMLLSHRAKFQACGRKQTSQHFIRRTIHQM